MIDFNSDAGAGVLIAVGVAKENERWLILKLKALVTTPGATGDFISLEDSEGKEIDFFGTATVDDQGHAGIATAPEGAQGHEPGIPAGISERGVGLSVSANTPGAVARIALLAKRIESVEN